MPQVKWLPEALEDVERLYEFLREKSPGAATRAARVIFDGVGLLRSMPEIGRPMNDETSRRKVVISFRAEAFGLKTVRYVTDRHVTRGKRQGRK